MTKSMNVNRRWTLQSSTDAILSCTTRSEARQKYPGAINFLTKAGKLNEVISQIESKKNHPSYEESVAMLRSCKSRKEFNEKYPSAAEHLRWIGKYNEEITFLDKERKDWDDASAIAEIENGYKNQEDFRKNCRGAYGYLQKHGLLEEVRKRLPGRFRWKKEDCIELAKPYVYIAEFEREQPKAYHAARYNGWLGEVCAHMKPYDHNKYTNVQLAEIASGYETRTEFHDNDKGAYSAARKRGILDEICSHMKVFSSSHTIEECREAALHCKNRKAFNDKYPALYSYCLQHGWLDEVCSHMQKRVTVERTYWTKEQVEELALQFEFKQEFKDAYPNAYGWMYRHGYTKEMCAHMKACGNNYKRCIYAVEFDDHCVYVGLTYKPVERWRCERTDPRETVYKHMQKS